MINNGPKLQNGGILDMCSQLDKLGYRTILIDKIKIIVGGLDLVEFSV